ILGLMFVPAVVLRRPLVQAAVFLADVGFISWAMYVSGAAGSDLYLAYFLVILISGMQRSVAHSFLTGGAAAAVYAFLWSQGHPDGSLLDVSVALRLPFFLIVAFFSAFFVKQSEEHELRWDQAQASLLEAEKLAYVGRLAGGIAQEFNNLTTVILGYCGLLEEGLPKDSPELGKVNTISEAATRMSQLTYQLLTCSRKNITQPQDICVDRFLDSSRADLQGLLGRGIGLELQLDAGAQRVRIDPALLRQVLRSLAANARDAMPGGGKLLLRTAVVPAAAGSAGSGQSGRSVCLCLEDTGCGMSGEVVARLFEPFFTTKDPGQGTGLGLASAYGIVKGADGDI
ncbi:MAG: ATP-binding protein, partial [Elusimicrobiota bacterium]